MFKKFILGASSVSLGSVAITTVNFCLTEYAKYENENWYKNEYSKVQVTNSNYIKGVDASSYAEVIEGILWSQGIQKNYGDITSEEQNVFKDFEGNYDNLFKILSDNGVNSLRLRIWNDPYDENGVSYSGGHNDILTDAWIANQAAANGIDSIFLDFHYSDFWADPNRQWLPKAWVNYKSVERLKNEVYNYTYNTLKTFYENTNIIPDKIQIGNEITKATFWSSDGSGKNDFNTTSTVLKGGFEAVEKFEQELNVSIKTSIHIDGTPSLYFWKKILDSYLIENKLSDYVEEIGITHYPDFNGIARKLYNVMRLIKNDYNLPSYVAETAIPFTNSQTDSSGDLISSQTNKRRWIAEPTAGAQVKQMASVMEASSRALPDDETGFYWWEPAWSFNSETSWSTRAGIKYAEQGVINAQDTFLTGNTWWNRGFFDKNNNPLPVLHEIKSFSRLGSSNYFDSNLLFNKTLLKKFEDDIVYLNQNIYITENGWNNSIDADKTIDFSDFEIKTTSESSKVVKQFLINNPSVIESQVQFDNFVFNENGGSFTVESSSTNYYYKNFSPVTVNFTFKTVIEKQYTIDYSSNQIEIDSSNQEWSKAILPILASDTSLKENVITNLWKTIVPEYFVDNNYSWWDINDEGYAVFYDRKNDSSKLESANRYLKTWFVFNSSESLIKNDTLSYDFINQKSSWPKTLKKCTYNVNLYLTKSVDFDLYKMENWKELKTVSILFNVKVT